MDASRIGHYFADSELVVKWIDVPHVGDRNIAALGIGKARVLGEVVERVRRFLPEAELDCAEHHAAGDAPYICGAMLGDGWVQLFFDSSRRLTEIRIDAYQLN